MAPIGTPILTLFPPDVESASLGRRSPELKPHKEKNLSLPVTKPEFVLRDVYAILARDESHPQKKKSVFYESTFLRFLKSMEDDVPDRFLLYECRVPAEFWGKEWAAAQAEKPEYKPEYITRMMEFKKATKSTKAHYKCKTRDGEKYVISLEELVEFKAQGLFEGK